MELNPNIILGFKSPDILSADERAMNAQKLQAGQFANQESQMKLDAYNQANQAKSAQDSIIRSAGSDHSKAINDLYQAGYTDRANELAKFIDERTKNTDTHNAATQAYDKNKWEKVAQISMGVSQAPDAQIHDAAFNGLKILVQSGVFTPEEFNKMASDMQGMNPAQLRQQAQGLASHALSVKDQLPKAQTTDYGGYKAQEAVNPMTGQVNTLANVDKTQTPDSIASNINAQLTRQETNRHNLATENQAKITNNNKVTNKTPLSSAAQKELFDAQDAIEGSKNALESFEQALKINKKAMGGYGSGALATVGSVLPNAIRPATVDATKDLDNILQGSALPQLKAIFGGMPTEGERAILLDVQGSSSQPAEVREKIFERAKNAINRRIQYNQQKSQALRDGSFFTEGASTELPNISNNNKPAKQNVPANAIRVKNKAEADRLPVGTPFITPDGRVLVR